LFINKLFGRGLQHENYFVSIINLFIFGKAKKLKKKNNLILEKQKKNRRFSLLNPDEFSR